MFQYSDLKIERVYMSHQFEILKKLRHINTAFLINSELNKRNYYFICSI